MGISGDALAGALAAGVAGLATAIATWRAGREQGKASFVKAVQEAAHIVIKDLRDELERSRADNASLRRENAEAHAQCQVQLDDLRSQIDRLMQQHPPASYSK